MDLIRFKDSADIHGRIVGQVVEGAVEGNPDNTMKPNDNLERAQAIAMLMRLFIKSLGW